MLVILFAMYPYWNDSLVHQTPEEYIEEMRQDSSWGGEFEIISACVLYNVSINISYEQENTPNTMFPNINKEYKIRDQQFHNRAIHSTPIYTPIWGLYHTGVVDNAGTHYQYNRNVYSTNIQFNNSSFNGTNCSSLPYNKLNTEYKDQYYTKLNAEYMNQYYNHLISKIEQTYSPDRFQSPSPIASMQSSPSSPLQPRYATFGSPVYSSPEIISPASSIGSIGSYASPDSPSPPISKEREKQLLEFSDEMLVNMFKNSSLIELSKLYYTNTKTKKVNKVYMGKKDALYILSKKIIK